MASLPLPLQYSIPRKHNLSIPQSFPFPNRDNILEPGILDIPTSPRHNSYQDPQQRIHLRQSKRPRPLDPYLRVKPPHRHRTTPPSLYLAKNPRSDAHPRNDILHSHRSLRCIYSIHIHLPPPPSFPIHSPLNGHLQSCRLHDPISPSSHATKNASIPIQIHRRPSSQKRKIRFKLDRQSIPTHHCRNAVSPLRHLRVHCILPC